MASKRVTASLFAARGCLLQGQGVEAMSKVFTTIPSARRSFATETSIPESSSNLTRSIPLQPLPEPGIFVPRREQSVLTTVYKFPTLEPLQFSRYPAEFLDAPLRRDILHKAVIYEGDCHRLGQAHTLWRNQVYGSGRKVRPQKGTGRARLGDKKSPMLKGGGVAHGPHPRDFSTKLPKKIYDLAWRIALSYRYRMEELVVVDQLVLKEGDPGLIKKILEQNKWGNEHLRSLLITEDVNDEMTLALKELGMEGRTLPLADVDVKDCLELGRLVIERGALDKIMNMRLPEELKPADL